MRTALSLSLLAWASLSLPIWQLSSTRAWRPMARRVRTTWKLLPEASRTNRSSAAVCFLAQPGSCASGTWLNTFSVTAAAGVGPESRAAVKVSGCGSGPIPRGFAVAFLFMLFFSLVMQADGNGSGDYLHSGMRGGPQVGAFRRCSFTDTEIKLQLESTSISRNPPAG